MGADFVRTFHELEADSPRRSLLVIAVAAVLIAAWSGWLFFGRVALYSATDMARLEVVSRVYPMEAVVAGRIKMTRLALGNSVRGGDILLELDPEETERQLQEDRTHLAALTPELARVSSEIDAESQSLTSEENAGKLALDQARVQSKGAEAAARTAHAIARRYEAAREVVPLVSILQAQKEAEIARTNADNMRLEIDHTQGNQQTKESDRSAHIDQLKQDQAKLTGEQQSTESAINRLQYEIDERSIRAPVTGRVASSAGLEVGAFVKEGERLGTIVPPGKIRAVAEFLPSDALGRFHPGQPAWLHLAGFPWTQYGSVEATVASVASEPQEGRIRVELKLNPNLPRRIPIQHGLPGTAEIQVGLISPAALIMRAAGRLITSPRDSQNSSPAAQVSPSTVGSPDNSDDQ
jgi:multidrug resistance efflux pump